MDASFGIATQALNDAIEGLWNVRQLRVRGLCVFVEKKPSAFTKLNVFANSHSNDRVRLRALKGRFIENLPAIDKHVAEIGKNPFKFFFLDQKGWAATPMDKMRPFLSSNRSCEVFLT